MASTWMAVINTKMARMPWTELRDRLNARVEELARKPGCGPVEVFIHAYQDEDGPGAVLYARAEHDDEET